MNYICINNSYHNVLLLHRIFILKMMCLVSLELIQIYSMHVYKPDIPDMSGSKFSGGTYIIYKGKSNAMQALGPRALCVLYIKSFQ